MFFGEVTSFGSERFPLQFNISLFLRGLRHRNLSAIRHATQRGLHQLQQLHGGHGPDHGNQIKAKGSPLMIQGFRSNPKDPESHILFFDIEALIGIKLAAMPAEIGFPFLACFV